MKPLSRNAPVLMWRRRGGGAARWAPSTLHAPRSSCGSPPQRRARGQRGRRRRAGGRRGPWTAQRSGPGRHGDSRSLARSRRRSGRGRGGMRRPLAQVGGFVWGGRARDAHIGAGAAGARPPAVL
ncbi:hypothetical protein K505DRAFT_58129 [Melanomma pulvis-pyrius CBS 109.77]|uniref:Uncharacterized protein n=1 Tax=Melanomma pulvis-pyrius CBS 109.77 TaxID=1314802 RepID=A0A6A6XUX6_9PLEO|nr:hypothetical protein K505DRAFT_58129 [Melanomma pulvis-pyrius CBS 109.77]